MSDGATSVLRRINTTPLGDLLRGRLTGRVDWDGNVRSAGLAPQLAELIRRIVKKTRLFRGEKVAVANELIAHFSDGLAHGSSAEELIQKFGDERVAIRLIRRAKSRCRSLPWHALRIAIRGAVILLGIYALLLLRFFIGRPNVSIDYVAQMNEPQQRIAENDRAWPIWRRAILASSDGIKEGKLTFSDAVEAIPGKSNWPETVKWLHQHAPAIELARQAGEKPAMGFIVGAGGSADDTELFPSSAGHQSVGEPVISLLLPHLNLMRQMANQLSLDARLEAQSKDAHGVEEDLLSMLGLARQLRGPGGAYVVSQLVALGIDSLAVDRFKGILEENPGLFSDDQLIRLAHAMSGPNVAADLMTFRDERVFFADVVQRIYTDDGRGDGNITPAGLRLMPMFVSMDGQGRDAMELNVFDFAATVPGLIASRAEMLHRYDQIMDQQQANLHFPIREVDFKIVQSMLMSIKQSPADRMHYLLIDQLAPIFNRAQAQCERYLGERDGALVAIALEIYRRRYGKYPAALTELAPKFLPAIPADRITGDPVKYGLRDGKPIVYSVGADRIDDGGVRPDRKSRSGRYDGAEWGISPKDAPHGDWVLLGRDAAEEDDN